MCVTSLKGHLKKTVDLENVVI